MFRTLRQRLILSHVLPVLVIVPIIGIALIYALETTVLLPELADELIGQARLIALLAAKNPTLWTDQAEAQTFVGNIQIELPTRIELLDSNGRLFASSDPNDIQRLGQPMDHPALTEVLQGQESVRTAYSTSLHAEITDILYPVSAANGQVVGVIRLSHRLATVQELFGRVRYLIIGILMASLGLGVLVGLLLALNMEHPLRQVTLAVYSLTQGNLMKPLTEHGPEEIRLLSRAVNTLVERLRGLEQARRQLLANLVHELGRPLGAVHSAIYALMGRSGKVDATRQELLTGMEGEVLRLERLLDDLAGLHDQVLGTLELRRYSLDLNHWLPKILVPWQQAAKQKGLEWQLEVPTRPVEVEADPDRLAQTVGNLVSNAIKYTPESGVIGVSAGQADGKIWIRVSDTGQGISPDEQSQIFQPLYRGQSSGRFPQGMGLGLSIARDLVAAHGGRIDVDSTPGHGSRFTIWLPARLVPPEAEKRLPSATE